MNFKILKKCTAFSQVANVQLVSSNFKSMNDIYQFAIDSSDYLNYFQQKKMICI